MKQRVAPNKKSDGNHEPLKENIVHDVNAKQGKTAHNKWQHGAVNGASQ